MARLFVSVGLVLAALIAFLAVISRAESVLTSDSYFLFDLYHDWFHYGLSPKEWALPGAISLFPDWLLLFPLLAVVDNTGIALALYDAVLFFLLLFTFEHIARRFSENAFERFVAVTIPAVLVFSLLDRIDPAVGFLQVFHPVHHASALPMSVVAVFCFVDAAKAGGYSRWTAGGLWLVSVLMILSDRIFAVQALVPLLLSAGILVTLRMITFKTSWQTVALCLTGLAVGWLARAQLPLWGLHSAAVPTRDQFSWALLSWNLVEPMVTLLREQTLPTDPGLWLTFRLGIGLAALAFGALVVRRFRSNEATGAAAATLLTILLVIACTLIGPSLLLLGSWGDLMSVRYVEPAYVLPAFIGSVALLSIRQAWVRWLGWAAAFVFAISILVPSIERWKDLKITLDYSNTIACLDRTVRDYQLHYGYAEYWTSRPVNNLSREHVRVLTLDYGLGPGPLVTDRGWYRRLLDAHPERLFFLMNNNSPRRFSEGLLESILGRPTATVACGDFDVWIYTGTPRFVPRGL